MHQTNLSNMIKISVCICVLIIINFNVYALTELNSENKVQSQYYSSTFIDGQFDNMTINKNNELELSLQTKYIKDDFYNNSNIDYSNNVFIDPNKNYAILEKLSRPYGGDNRDEGNCVQQTNDGGYIIVGDTYSFGNGDSDIWVIKTDISGIIEWEKYFGGSKYDSGKSIQQTNDGGYIIGGTTYSFGDGYGDIWIIKLDSSGNKKWEKILDKSDQEQLGSIRQTSDDGFIIVGMTNKKGILDDDLWLIKTDSKGKVLWNRIFGGDSYETGFSVQQTSDGGYIISGSTYSFAKSPGDVWLIRTNNYGFEVHRFLPI